MKFQEKGKMVVDDGELVSTFTLTRPTKGPTPDTIMVEGTEQICNVAWCFLSIRALKVSRRGALLVTKGDLIELVQ